MADIAGFDRPILHGLASFGIIGKAVVDVFCNGDTKKFKSISCRFSSHVFPGDELEIKMWKQGNDKIMIKTLNINTNKDALIG